MHKAIAVGIAALALVACGGSSQDSQDAGAPDAGVADAGQPWAGHWDGVLTIGAISCSDGSSGPGSTDNGGLTTQQNGNQVSWRANCGATIIGQINGNVATVAPVSCPAVQVDGGSGGGEQIATTWSGTLTLDGNALSLDMALKLDVAGHGQTATCNAAETGTLARQ